MDGRSLGEDVGFEGSHHVAGCLVSGDTVNTCDSHSEESRSLPNDLGKVASSGNELEVIKIDLADFTVPSIGSVGSVGNGVSVRVHGQVLSTSGSIFTLGVLHLVLVVQFLGVGLSGFSHFRVNCHRADLVHFPVLVVSVQVHLVELSVVTGIVAVYFGRLNSGGFASGRYIRERHLNIGLPFSLGIVTTCRLLECPGWLINDSRSYSSRFVSSFDLVDIVLSLRHSHAAADDDDDHHDNNETSDNGSNEGTNGHSAFY